MKLYEAPSPNARRVHILWPKKVLSVIVSRWTSVLLKIFQPIIWQKTPRSGAHAGVG